MRSKSASTALAIGLVAYTCGDQRLPPGNVAEWLRRCPAKALGSARANISWLPPVQEGLLWQKQLTFHPVLRRSVCSAIGSGYRGGDLRYVFDKRAASGSTRQPGM
ncbi:hypothetical protein EMWEY_00033220 [Eimeria maxima]|uniref:Uncharacterized protein n=1 Tax=Eimeria maxima TaxID=5804 RepID=U6MG72_EIMMA|nr:hypothetical protein EMWEY_00033220 [Eimeria maxima]CDJ60640.1 hypothetical protein EMWEY_00033220 [Eimeria maxima]